MNQVPQQVWKDIDKEIGLRTSLVKQLVQSEDIDLALDKLYNEIKEDFEQNTLSAFFSFGMLFLEHVAISKFINKNQCFDLRYALPEVLSLRDIYELFKLDRMRSLNALEKQQLELLLYRALGSLDELL